MYFLRHDKVAVAGLDAFDKRGGIVTVGCAASRVHHRRPDKTACTKRAECEEFRHKNVVASMES